MPFGTTDKNLCRSTPIVIPVVVFRANNTKGVKVSQLKPSFSIQLAALYVHACEAIAAGATSDRQVAEWLEHKGPLLNSLGLSDMPASRPSVRTAIEVVEKHFNVPEGQYFIPSLAPKGSKKKIAVESLEVTPEGWAAYARLVPLVVEWQRVITQKELHYVDTLTIATQNMHEVAVMCSGPVFQWIQRFTERTESNPKKPVEDAYITPIHVAVREVDSYAESVAGLVNGQIHVAFDCTPKVEIPTESDAYGVTVIYDRPLRLVLLLPKLWQHNDSFSDLVPRRDKGLMLSNLGQIPLCHVSNIERHFLKAGHLARRVVVTNSLAVSSFIRSTRAAIGDDYMKSRSMYAGINIGWSRVLGDRWRDDFDYIFLNEEWATLYPWIMYRKPADPIVEEMSRCIEEFFTGPDVGEILRPVHVRT